MDPFTPPGPRPRKQCHSKRYRDSHKRNVSDSSEPASADEELQQNTVDPLQLESAEGRLPSPLPEGEDDLALPACDPAKKTGPIDGYLQEVLRHSLFVDSDTFLQTILNMPADWRTTYKSVIDDVLADQDFDRLLNEYLEEANIISADHDREKHDNLVHYHCLDPRVAKGSKDQLKPDIIGIVTRIFASAKDKRKRDALKKFAEDRELNTKKGAKGQEPAQKTLKPDNVPTWSHCTDTKVMKATDRALDDGMKAIRLLSKDGQDPLKSFPSEKQVKNNQLDKQVADDVPSTPGNPSRIKERRPDSRDEKMKGTDDILNKDDSRNVFTNGGREPPTAVPHESRVGDCLSEEDGGPSAAADDWAWQDEQVVDDVPSTSSVSSSFRKRKSDCSDESFSKVLRVSHGSRPSGAAKRALGPIDEDGFPTGVPSDEQGRVQCARYAMRILSSAGLRSHTLATLIDRDCLQLIYYDRSSVVASQAIDIADEEDRRTFVAMLIGYHHLTLSLHGILYHILTDPYIKNFGPSRHPAYLFHGRHMSLQKDDGTNIILKLGGILHRQGGLIGRDTCVVAARSPAWPGRELVVKISWPSIHPDSEKKLIDAAKVKAEEMAGEGQRHWVLDHLPDILHSQDFRFDDEDSSQRRPAELLKEAFYADDKTFIYEEHLLRITISEHLFPMTDLTNVKDIAQAFLDIFQCHFWLYEHPKILHRDMSLKNMMYRRRCDDSKQKFQILGVLNDFDLASFLPLRKVTSLHRTGTPPFMAHELLGKSVIGHLYRHDLEAFYYILSILCCRYEVVEGPKGPVVQGLKSTEGEIPFDQWFDRTISWQALAAIKRSFLMSDNETIPTASFAVFRPWLDNFHRAFCAGLKARPMRRILYPIEPIYLESVPQRDRHLYANLSESSSPLSPFDDETLSGHIIYSKFLAIMSKFDGHSLVTKSVA